MTLDRRPFCAPGVTRLNGAPYVVGMFNKAAVIKSIVIIAVQPIDARPCHAGSAVTKPKIFDVLESEKILDSFAAVPLIRSVAVIVATLNDGAEHCAQPVVKVMLLPVGLLRRDSVFVGGVILAAVIGVFVHDSGDAPLLSVAVIKPLHLPNFLRALFIRDYVAAFVRTVFLPNRVGHILLFTVPTPTPSRFQFLAHRATPFAVTCMVNPLFTITFIVKRETMQGLF